MATTFSTADVLGGQDILGRGNIQDTYTGQSSAYENEPVSNTDDAFNEHDIEEEAQNEVTENFANEYSGKQQSPFPRSLYFIRKPRPDLTLDDIQIQKHRLQFEQQKLIFQQYSETAKIIMVKRDQARESTQKALDAFKSTKTEIQAKRDKLSAFNVSDPKKREKIRELEKQLPPNVKSEEDLDNLLNSINYSLTHETLSLQQEKKFVGDLTRLQKLRPIAQEYEENFKEVQKQRDDIKQIEPDRNKTRSELEQLNKQKDMAGNIYGECKKQQDTIRDNLSEVQKKKDEAKLKKDAAYDDWLKAKETKKEKFQEFRQNREFSKEVRSLVETSNLEQAIEMCGTQIEEMMTQLFDKNYRKEYIKLWEIQKSRPVLDADFKMDNTVTNENEKLKVQIPQETDDVIKQAMSNVNKATQALTGETEQVASIQPETTEKTLEATVPKVSEKQAKPKEEAATKATTRGVENGSFNVKSALENIIQDFELPSAIVGKKSNQAKEEEADLREYNQRKFEEAERRKQRQEERRVQKQKKREEQRIRDEQNKLEGQQQATDTSAAEITDKENDVLPVTSGDELPQTQEEKVELLSTSTIPKSRKNRLDKQYLRKYQTNRDRQFRPQKKADKNQNQKILKQAQKFIEKNQGGLVAGGVVIVILLAAIIYSVTA